jgi:uncharacterized protein (TIGR04141 family)
MTVQKPFRRLNAFLAREEFETDEFEDFLADEVPTREIELSQHFTFDGALFVKISQTKRPRWAHFVDEIAGRIVDEITNRSSSAVLFIRTSGRVFAFTFGYGRYLLNLGRFRQDFGLRTALNTLDHESLRSVDLHTLEDQPIQKKSQSIRGSEASVFGIDIYRDVLRAVTGSPRRGVDYRSISGGDAMYSFGINVLVEELPTISQQLLGHYEMDHYAETFGWVDNIRKVKDNETLMALDGQLLNDIRQEEPESVITLPEVVKWDEVVGFSFTRTKKEISPTIESMKYFENISNKDQLTVDSLKRDRLYLTDINELEHSYSIYSCAYIELESEETKNVLFGGNWYEIDKSFMSSIDSVLQSIAVSEIDFPGVEVWEEDGKQKIETEGDYNERAADELDCYLLDKKLIKTTKTTSPIELCDLLTGDKEFVHVKHRKGGSAGLSHLFAQGNVAAELMLGDKLFRKKARSRLRSVSPGIDELLPLDRINSNEYEIVFLILGHPSDSILDTLPFFSKVNLSRTFENLSQRGYRVSISGAEKVERVT